MRAIPRALILVSLWSASLTYACELSPEYLQLRDIIFNKVDERFQSCTDAARSYTYWKLFSQCYSENVGTDIVNHCDDKVAYRVARAAREESVHCDVFKLTRAEMQQLLDETAISIEVEPCMDES